MNDDTAANANANANAEPQPAAQVARYWGDERKDLVKHNWLEHPVTQAWFYRRRAGDPKANLYDYWRDKFLSTPAPLALSVGCGFGAFERVALMWNLAQRFEACDLSENAIAQARIYAAEQGLADRVTYSVANLDAVSLPEARYDAIFGISSLHHVTELDHLFAQCRQALKPGGLLFVDEYVGPARFQSAPHVVALINRLIGILPERYRRSVYLNGAPRQAYENPPPEMFEHSDPSEAIRSDAIVPTLSRYFEIIDYKPYGGALLHMLLSGTAGNFDPASDSDIALLEMMALLEEELEKAGVIGSDFVSLVAKPKP
ncbi:MAG: methyltransferase domain-containing protein [Rhodospirillaceae bacterium]|nr:methyltransferase domain-containing protein [Rhodospirillaceae bacterium]